MDIKKKFNVLKTVLYLTGLFRPYPRNSGHGAKCSMCFRIKELAFTE
jgi:hypothetical protein